MFLPFFYDMCEQTGLNRQSYECESYSSPELLALFVRRMGVEPICPVGRAYETPVPAVIRPPQIKVSPLSSCNKRCITNHNLHSQKICMHQMTNLVRMKGLEPLRDCSHTALNRTRISCSATLAFRACGRARTTRSFTIHWELHYLRVFMVPLVR